MVYVNDTGGALASNSASLMEIALNGVTGILSASNFKAMRSPRPSETKLPAPEYRRGSRIVGFRMPNVARLKEHLPVIARCRGVDGTARTHFRRRRY
jgi:hypothetical protein